MEENLSPFRKLHKSDINQDKGFDTLNVTENGKFIVRKRQFKERYFRYFLPRNFNELDDKKKREILIDVSIKIKKLLDELNSYGIKTSFEVVLGKDDEGIDTIYILTNLVHGFDLINFDPNQEDDFKQKLIRTISGLVDYLINKVSNNEIYITDLPSLGQFVYGNIDGENPDVYMVDTDIKFLSNTGLVDGLYLYSLKETMIYCQKVGIDISKSQKKLYSFYVNNKHKFLDTYDIMIEWLDSLASI